MGWVTACRVAGGWEWAGIAYVGGWRRPKWLQVVQNGESGSLGKYRSLPWRSASSIARVVKWVEEVALGWAIPGGGAGLGWGVDANAGVGLGVGAYVGLGWGSEERSMELLA